MSQVLDPCREGSALPVSNTLSVGLIRFRYLSEGRAKFAVPIQQRLAFCNPKMVLDRDLSVRILRAVGRVRPSSVLDATAGIGVRGIRYYLEVGGVEDVVLCDANRFATLFCRFNVDANSLPRGTRVLNIDVRDLKANEEFDVVDIDPFGSPAVLFGTALSAVRDGGIIAVTATDLATLAGYYPDTCFRRYGVRVARTEFGREVACRALMAALSEAAATSGASLDPLFSYARGHYARLFLRKGRCDTKQFGYIRYCKSCSHRLAGPELAGLDETCAHCHATTHVIGPVWLGDLWNHELLDELTDSDEPSEFGDGIRRLATVAKDECDLPATYYVTDQISRRLRLSTPGTLDVVERLREMGFSASETIFDPKGIRTNAPVEAIDGTVRG